MLSINLVSMLINFVSMKKAFLPLAGNGKGRWTHTVLVWLAFWKHENIKIFLYLFRQNFI